MLHPTPPLPVNQTLPSGRYDNTRRVTGRPTRAVSAPPAVCCAAQKSQTQAYVICAYQCTLQRWCNSSLLGGGAEFGIHCCCAALVLTMCCVCLQVLLVSSSRHPDQWIVPGGGMEPEEDPCGAAVREVFEEVRRRLLRLYGGKGGGVTHLTHLTCASAW